MASSSAAGTFFSAKDTFLDLLYVLQAFGGLQFCHRRLFFDQKHVPGFCVHITSFWCHRRRGRRRRRRRRRNNPPTQTHPRPNTRTGTTYLVQGNPLTLILDFLYYLCGMSWGPRSNSVRSEFEQFSHKLRTYFVHAHRNFVHTSSKLRTNFTQTCKLCTNSVQTS